MASELMIQDGQRPTNLGITQINEIFAENPTRYADIPQFLVEIRKRTSPFYSKVPLLTKHNSSNPGQDLGGRLIHFRGAVQNNHSYEMFSPRFTVETGVGQTDELTAAFADSGLMCRVINEDPCVTRYLYTLSTVPGEAKWAQLTGDDESLVDQISHLDIGSNSDDGDQWQIVIRLYEEEATDLPIGSIIEFYGIFYPGISLEKKETDFFQPEHAVFTFPNVHVIEHRLLSRMDLIRHPMGPQIGCLSESLQHFANALTGCESAGFYFLAAMVARTYDWREELPVPLCSASLAFLNVNEPRPLIEFAKLLVPLVYVLPITAELLENVRLFSAFNHEDGILRVGKLQLCRGTLLILDFTHYTKAAVPTDNNFVQENVATLHRLVMEQKLTVDCGYGNRYGLHVDIPVMALCPGVNTYFLKFTALVPIPKPFTNGLDPVAELRAVGSDELQQFRWFLAECHGRLQSIKMEHDEQMKFVESFTGIRQALNTAAPEHFRHLLTLTRIRAALDGELGMRNSAFQTLLASEYERLDTLKAFRLI